MIIVSELHASVLQELHRCASHQTERTRNKSIEKKWFVMIRDANESSSSLSLSWCSSPALAAAQKRVPNESQGKSSVEDLPRKCLVRNLIRYLALLPSNSKWCRQFVTVMFDCNSIITLHVACRDQFFFVFPLNICIRDGSLTMHWQFSFSLSLLIDDWRMR